MMGDVVACCAFGNYGNRHGRHHGSYVVWRVCRLVALAGSESVNCGASVKINVNIYKFYSLQ